jgi:hypothetical protein
VVARNDDIELRSISWRSDSYPPFVTTISLFFFSPGVLNVAIVYH